MRIDSPYLVGWHADPPTIYWRQSPWRRVALRVAVIAVFVGLVIGRVGSALAEEDPERFEPSTRSPRQVVEELAVRHFPPEAVPWAMSTAACESGFIHFRRAGYDSRLQVYYDFNGPWHVDAVTWSATAWQLFDGPLTDLDVASAMAAWIYRNFGRSPWPVCGYRGGW